MRVVQGIPSKFQRCEAIADCFDITIGPPFVDMTPSEMAMCQQEVVQSAEAGSAPEQLALRTLSAVDHDAAAPGFHQKTRMVAVR